jgi:hypothetical protein
MFCGNEAVLQAAEDVIPMWLQNKLRHFAELRHPGQLPNFVGHTYDDEGAFRADVAEGTTGARAVSQVVTGARPAPFTLPGVCETCNRGWMSRLEEANKHLLPGLLEGRPKFLAPFDQFLIAMWVVKTCLTYDAHLPARYVAPEPGTRRLFAQGYPLPLSLVDLGNDPDHQMEGAYLHRRKWVRQANAPGITGVLVSFQFDRLIVRAVINVADDFSEPQLGIGWPIRSPYFQRVWPPHQGGFVWPSVAASAPRGAPPATDWTEPPMPEPAA